MGVSCHRDEKWSNVTGLGLNICAIVTILSIKNNERKRNTRRNEHKVNDQFEPRFKLNCLKLKTNLDLLRED